jgi:hypothetical protein
MNDLTLTEELAKQREGRPLLVCIVVHDRFKNIQRWLECWRACNRYDAKLAVINNHDGDRPKIAWRQLANDPALDFFIGRRNVGFDLGALQALHQGKVAMPFQWKDLIWICDDSLPMNTDFVGYLLRALYQPGTGVAGVETSEEVRFHLRTNMYAIKRETLDQLEYPANPVTTKMESYEFEHHDPDKHLAEQIKRLGMSVVQAHENIHALAWDTGHHRRDDRWEEFWGVFPSTRQLGRMAK